MGITYFCRALRSWVEGVLSKTFAHKGIEIAFECKCRHRRVWITKCLFLLELYWRIYIKSLACLYVCMYICMCVLILKTKTTRIRGGLPPQNSSLLKGSPMFNLSCNFIYLTNSLINLCRHLLKNHTNINNSKLNIITCHNISLSMKVTIYASVKIFNKIIPVKHLIYGY